MSNLEMWSLIVGAVLPVAIAIPQQKHWAEWQRAALTAGAVVVAGAGTAYFQGDLTGKRWVESLLVVAVATLSTYQGFWKPTKIAPTVEHATRIRR